MFLPQLPKHLLARQMVFEQADFPQLLAHKLRVRVAEELDHEGIDIGDLARDRIQQQHAVPRRLKKSAVTNLRDAQGGPRGLLQSAGLRIRAADGTGRGARYGNPGPSGTASSAHPDDRELD